MESVVGFRFRPTEEEMITYYLDRKLRGLDFPVHVINEVAMNTLEPCVLPAYSAIESDDRVWYFFTVPDYMDAKRTRINRKTPAGFWKVTGRDRPVKDREGREIGLKKTLVFQKGRSPNGVKTCWAMQEFHHKDATRLYRRPYVVCRLKRKSDDRDEQGTHSASNSGNQSAVNVVSQENNEQLLDLQSMLDNDELYDNSIPEVWRLPEERPSSSNVSINEPNASRSLWDTSEQDDDDFVNSLWASDVDEHIDDDGLDQYSIMMLLNDDVDENMDEDEQDENFGNTISATLIDEHIHEETVQAQPHDFNPVKSLSGYVETTHPQDGNVVEFQGLILDHSQDDSVIPATVLQADGVGLHKKEETSLSHDKILKTVETIKKAETPSSFSGRLQGNYVPRTRGLAEMTAGDVAQIGGGALHKKEEISLSREKTLKKFQISGKASSKLLSDGSNGSSRKSSFIFQETPPSSHKQVPPSVYIVNIVAALILLVFFVREMASLH